MKLADWNDPSVQRVYAILCNDLRDKPDHEHWEGYCARWIVAAEVQPLRDALKELTFSPYGAVRDIANAALAEKAKEPK